MKIHTQDGRGVFDFGNVFISDTGPDNVIQIQGKKERYSHFLGRYADGARARGVILDIEAAYYQGTKIFYMPWE